MKIERGIEMGMEMEMEMEIRMEIGMNQSPKGNIWSAIPIALFCIIVNKGERRQGSGP